MRYTRQLHYLTVIRLLQKRTTTTTTLTSNQTTMNRKAWTDLAIVAPRKKEAASLAKRGYCNRICTKGTHYRTKTLAATTLVHSIGRKRLQQHLFVLHYSRQYCKLDVVQVRRAAADVYVRTKNGYSNPFIAVMKVIPLKFEVLCPPNVGAHLTD